MYIKYASGKGINEGRIVLHSDLNNFFATVECKHRPELCGFPVAVCGSRQDRHGIVLAKNELAKMYGVKTAEPIWQAKSKCSSLVIVPPNYDEYMRYSSIVKKIYCEYTDRVESFGIDEAWLELTGDCKIKTLQQGEQLAEEIRQRVKKKTGLTVSVGVSDNKIFSKLASDYKKPDAVTVFSPENYNSTVSRLCASELLFVGKNMTKTLHTYGINTIGDIANSSKEFLYTIFGKNGSRLYTDACGENTDVVRRWGEADETKSIGNSVTLPQDLKSLDEVKSVFCSLAEKVSYRLRCSGFACKTLAISVRNTSLKTSEKQCSITLTSNAVEIARAATQLYKDSFDTGSPVRSVGIRVCNLVRKDEGVQIDMFDNSYLKSERLSKIDAAADEVRERYGVSCITHLSAMKLKTKKQHPAFTRDMERYEQSMGGF